MERGREGEREREATEELKIKPNIALPLRVHFTANRYDHEQQAQITGRYEDMRGKDNMEGTRK